MFSLWRSKKAASQAAATEEVSDRERTMALLAEVRRIEFQTARLVEQHLAGSYQSVFRGQGVAFSEVRAYEPGDEVRTIDWNVTARTGEAHVKLFSEERELTVLIVADMSGSLDFGSEHGDKRSVVARLAATFAFSAIRNGDRVGLVGFSDEVEVFVPPRPGRKHVLSVVQKVLTHRPKGRGSSPANALDYIAKLGRSHMVVVLISDFIGALDRDAERFERTLKLVRRRHELIPVRVEDPLELELPPVGILTTEDLESVEWVRRDLSRSGARAYKKQVSEERERFDALMRRLRLESMSIQTRPGWEQEIVHFFARRARRSRR